MSIFKKPEKGFLAKLFKHKQVEELAEELVVGAESILLKDEAVGKVVEFPTVKPAVQEVPASPRRLLRRYPVSQPVKTEEPVKQEEEKEIHPLLRGIKPANEVTQTLIVKKEKSSSPIPTAEEVGGDGNISASPSVMTAEEIAKNAPVESTPLFTDKMSAVRQSERVLNTAGEVEATPESITVDEVAAEYKEPVNFARSPIEEMMSAMQQRGDIPEEEPVAEETAEEPAVEEAAEEPVIEEVAEEPVEEETVEEPAVEEVAEEPVAEEVVEEPAVEEEPVAEDVAEEVVEEPVVEEVAEEPVAEETIEEPVVEEVAEEPVAEVVSAPAKEQKPAENRNSKNGKHNKKRNSYAEKQTSYNKNRTDRNTGKDKNKNNKDAEGLIGQTATFGKMTGTIIKTRIVELSPEDVRKRMRDERR